MFIFHLIIYSAIESYSHYFPNFSSFLQVSSLDFYFNSLLSLSHFPVFVYRCLILLFDLISLIVHQIFKEFNPQVNELLFLCFLHFKMFAILAILFVFCRHSFSLPIAICVHFLFPFSLCNNLFFFITFHSDSSSFSILHLTRLCFPIQILDAI